MQTTVSILGCGWLGTQLGKKLIFNGYKVKGSTSTPARIYELAEAEIQPYYLKLEPGIQQGGAEQFFRTDVLVISLPPGREADVEVFFPNQVAEIIRLIRQYHITRVLFISSTSVYESRNREVREGEEGVPEKPVGRALLEAEKMLSGEPSFRTTSIRFGGLIGPGRNPVRFFAGKRNIPGNEPVNLIHRTDGVNILYEVIEKNCWGEVFNACSPVHPTRQEFYLLAAAISGMPAPHFIPASRNYKIVNSDKLQQRLNYSFRYPSPMDYLTEISV